MLEAEPAKSFPRAMGSDAALEGFYRFINNDAFTAEEIFAPHVTATTERATEAGDVIALHDTTLVEYSTMRAGLGVTTHRTRRHGFVAQVSLVLSEKEGLPLGVAHLETLTRSGKKWSKRRQEGQRARVHHDDVGRESLRWIRGIEAVEEAASGRFNVIHVTDAEGDFFELFSRLHAMKGRFVIRAGQLDRIVVVDDQERNLREVVSELSPTARRKVELCERKYRHPRDKARSSRQRHPERSSRVARVAIASRQVTLKGTRYSTLKTEPFSVNVVRIWEPRPPTDEPPVEWVLITTEPTSTVQDLGGVVDLYRLRWTIEEYFKALKTGCSLEKRQVESYDALRKVLALFVPIAHQLLVLRGIERSDTRLSAKRVFSSTDLYILTNAPQNARLDPPRTVSDALRHLARLGGHIKNNGPPGWQTLGWGYEKLLVLRLGWEWLTHRDLVNLEPASGGNCTSSLVS